jgi:mono/diheme cytochrome c family protein
MRKRGLMILLLMLSHCGWAGATESVREGPVVLAAHASHLGEQIGDLPFTDLNGKTGKLSDYKDRKAVVVCVTSATCPVARKYGPTIVEMEKRFAPQGVTFFAVNLSAAESADKITEAAAEFQKAGWGGRYVIDHGATMGKALGTTSTTEVFVLDRARTMVYRGAINDQYGLGYALSEPRQHFLSNALQAVLRDDRPGIQATTAPGCALSVGERSASATKVTYHNRISRLVQNHCLECHRKGENGPFELNTYEDVKGNAAMIKKVVAKRTMPPWFADANAAHAFKNDRSLSERDRSDILQWVEAGCAEGDKADAPVTLAFTEGWRIGKPDLALEAPLVQTIPAKGTIRYRYVQVPTNLTEDKWVTAIEVRPSAPEVVHHLLVFIKLPPTDPRAAQYKAMNGGLNGYFAGMVPGQGHVTFPEGTAKLLPKGATLIFQIHYTTNGKEVQDRPRIGFKFADKAPEHEVLTRAAANRFFIIPANDPNFEITASHTFFQPVRLLSINPHSHVRGKAFKYELIYPDGRTDVILDLPRYDFNWQLEHQFAEPIDVPAGTRLKVTGWYDNSKDNPANPDPSKAVGFGEQTWQEMMIGYFTGYVLK